MRKARQASHGFSIAELIVVMTIVTILLSLLLPALAAAREKSRRITCLLNLKQVINGSLLYRDDDPEGSFTALSRPDENDFNWLYPELISETKLFVCPSTRNYIRPDARIQRPEGPVWVDLLDNGVYTDSPGTSYSILGFFGDGTKKTDSSVFTYVRKRSRAGMPGRAPGPADVWLILDADELRPGLRGSTPNTPDAHDNHRRAGGNVAFCDGHTEFVRAREYRYRFELSQDEDADRPR